MALNIAKDLGLMFRNTPDVDTMKEYGLDLSSYADVTANAEKINELIAGDSMPCDESWSAGRVGLFKRWIDEGMDP